MKAEGEPERAGKIITFYSYKGGTGRSMALANVAWSLASSGKRVLTIDWDLEAPGLHRYFEPFLADKSLERSTGIIDFVRDFATAAVAVKKSPEESPENTSGPSWYEDYSNLLAHAIPLKWEFAGGGLLHLVPAGKQDAAYAVRVNSFDWQDFYERLGGGILLESVKQKLRAVYDIILIDSRTGVSDTSGICTIQMPDELVVCFTLNRQSIYGITAAARSAFAQRRTASGDPTLKIWPVPTRVESFEKDRLEIASTMARARFSGLVWQLSPEQEDVYWGEIAVSYEPYYAYEEVLAAFRDRPRQAGSMLARMETIATYLNGGPLDRKETIDEVKKAEGLNAFTTRSASDYEQELLWLGDEYESIRKKMDGGGGRTELMTGLIGRAQVLASQRDAGAVAEKLFSRGTDGCRIVGLALARIDSRRQHIDLALSGIEESRSPFEQFHALLLAEKLLPSLHPTTATVLLAAIKSQLDKTIGNDPSRRTVAQRLIKKLDKTADLDVRTTPVVLEYALGRKTQVMLEILPASTHVRYEDVDESHGPWVKTKGTHSLRLPRSFRMGRSPVTNSLYQSFVQSDGYNNDEFWTVSRTARKRFLTLDGQSMGPGIWPNSETLPEGKEEHPVTSISYLEAQAFANWCNSLGGENPDRLWSLPPEDHWEFSARSEQGFIYPWGDAFDATKCNSSESGIGDTSEVARFEAGASQAGCRDMAGNVWEFVLTPESDGGSCVLRGGSFKNDRFLVRSYLRLFGVPLAHRAPDFGFRLAQVERSAGKQNMAIA
jgi:formylglycine-generating enzyme required for sulfatase activity/cellulose biosynthesis protein BcsQ